MQLNDQYFGGAQPPRTFSDVCVNGRPITLGAIVPSLIVLAVLLYQLHQEANIATIMLLVFIGMNCYAMLAAFFRPPQMAIRNGQFSLRFGQTGFRCPATDVVDLCQEEQAVHVGLCDVSRVEPDAARRRMEKVHGRSGCHIVIPAETYTLKQVNRLRTALGMPEQAADAAGQQLADFQSSVISHRSLVTAFLIAACVVVYLVKAIMQDRSLMGGDIDSCIAWGDDYAPRTLRGEWWRLLTYLFLHGNPFHILMNMWVLWDVGRLLERLVGHTAMALIYFLAGIAGGLASAAFHPQVPSIGASGAVFGVIGALFGLLLHARDAVPPARLQQLRSGIIAFVIFNVVFGFSLQGIDMAAHVGGAVAGLLAGLIVLPARATGHWLRIGVLVVAGSGAVLLASHFLPPPPRDAATVVKQFPEKQRQILDAYANLVQKHERQQLSDHEFTDRFEAQVVVPWRELTADLTDAMKGRMEPGRLRNLERYMHMRQEGFDDILAAIRNPDRQQRGEAMEKAMQKEDAAGRIANEPE